MYVWVPPAVSLFLRRNKTPSALSCPYYQRTRFVTGQRRRRRWRGRMKGCQSRGAYEWTTILVLLPSLVAGGPSRSTTMSLRFNKQLKRALWKHNIRRRERGGRLAQVEVCPLGKMISMLAARLLSRSRTVTGEHRVHKWLKCNYLLLLFAKRFLIGFKDVINSTSSHSSPRRRPSWAPAAVELIRY